MFDAPSVSKPYRHVYSGDGALDTQAEGYNHEQWIATGDEKFLPVRPGAAPVWFTFRHLPSKDVRFVQDVGTREGTHSMLWWLVALSLAEISPYVTQAGHRKLEFAVEMTGRRRVSDVDMDLICGADGGKLFAELAGRVFREVFGDPT